MRVFVAGGAGAIGRQLVPRLVDAGHEVTGTTRSAERAEALRATGAEAVEVDALDAEAVGAALAAARPEVVVHQLTAIPRVVQPRTMDRAFAMTNRLRSEGTRNLVLGAQAAGARRLVAQSVAFAYEPSGDWVKDESAPLWLDPPKAFRPIVHAINDLEAQVVGAEGLDGLVLRYGFFYGPGSPFERGGGSAEEVIKRRFPIIGNGQGRWPFVHVEDAAAATVTAVERGAPGIYNVTDDDPAPLREWLPGYAEALGAPPPRRAPALVARLIAGPMAVAYGTQLRAGSNAKAKRDLGWGPHHPSWRQGFLDEFRGAPRS